MRKRGGAKLEKLFEEKFLCNMIGFRCLGGGRRRVLREGRLRGIQFSYWFSICGVIVCWCNKDNYKVFIAMLTKVNSNFS